MNTGSGGTDARDPYVILGLPPNTPFAQVKVVYRRLVRELHPDVNPNDPAARARFDAVHQAFETLQKQHTAASPPRPVRDVAAEASMAQKLAQAARDSMRAQGYTPVPTAPLQPEADEFVEQDHPSVASVAASAPVTARAVPTTPALDILTIPGRDRLLLQPRAQMLYVLLETRLSEEVGSSNQALNLSLVLDHSSSMQRDDKLQRLKEAVARIIDMMDPRDYLSIVTFGDRATVLLPSAPLGNKRAAKEALDAIRCRGGTEISTGLRAGLTELQSHSANLISQMIVLTDGQTYGDEDICLAIASQAADRQIQIAALGLGDDWNSALLDELAMRTGGHSDYVQNADQLSGVFEDHLRTLQKTALRNVQMAITTGMSSRLLRVTLVSPGIKPFTIPTEPPPAGEPVEFELGRISTDRDYRLLLELVVASRNVGPTDVGEIRFTYDVPSLVREGESVSHRLQTNFVERWDVEPPVDLRVHDALRKITAHRLQEQAMQAIQEGQTQKGTASLRTAAKHLEDAGCTELADLAKSEATRIERQGQAQPGNMKRIIYGTRKLG